MAFPGGNIYNVHNSNLNTPTNINTVTLSHVAAPVANIHTPTDANMIPSHIPVTNTPSLNQNASEGTTASKSRKRKSDSDDAGLVLPDGSRRIRKKKSRPDENIAVSTKRGKKK